MSEPLDAWLEGQHVGRFSESDDRRVVFTYVPGAPQTPISLSLPRDRQHTRLAAKNFLENLLPDQAGTRARMARVYGADSTSTFDLLAKSGGDIAGGLVLVPAGTEPAKGSGYLAEALDSDIAERITAIKRDPDAWLPSDTLARFSLGGTQGKFALARVDGEWFWPNAAVPSTHILKPAAPVHRKLEEAEAAAMQLANRVGLTAPVAAVLQIEDQSTFIVERFDRLPAGPSAAGPFATRLRAEDFAQVSNTSPDNKYGLTALQVLRLLAPEDTDDRLAHQFISQLAYNTMLGNADAHAKNYSILLRPGSASEASIEMSPMYDVVPIGIYPFDQKLAMGIGGANLPQAVETHHWKKLAIKAELDPDEVLAIVGGIAEGIAANVDTVWTELDDGQQRVLREQLLRNTDRFVGLNETKRVRFGAPETTPDQSKKRRLAGPEQANLRQRFPELYPEDGTTDGSRLDDGPELG